jgi:hypothetical protein
MVSGALAALVVWYLLAAYYYWTYETIGELVRTGQMAPDEDMLMNATTSAMEAKAFVAPVGRLKLFAKLQEEPPPAIAQALKWMFNLLAHLGRNGFRIDPYDSTSPLHSGLKLSVIVFLFCSLLYFVLFHYTAPVPLLWAYLVVAITTALVLLVWLLAAFGYWKKTYSKDKPKARRSLVRTAVLLSPVWTLFVIALLPFQAHKGFPVLSSVFVLLIFICWLLAGFSFILDRARVPVLITSFIIIGLLHGLMKLPGLRQYEFDHTVHTDPRNAVTLLQPDEVLKRFHQARIDSNGDPLPLIIVTSTGGGIHAAFWTTQLLSLLEQKFHDDLDLKSLNEKAAPDKQISFHNSILLMSGVSGGSVGLESWLREYPTSGEPANVRFASLIDMRNQITNTTGCSSLEGVAWGLIFPDFLHLLFPFPVATGYDRGWALQAAIQHNQAAYGTDPKRQECGEGQPNVPPNVSLISLARELGDADGPRLPAFTLNATVAETGDRMLLSNYDVPISDNPMGLSDLLPAASFLDIYAKCKDNDRCGAPPPLKKPPQTMTDLSLTAAARLSASFTYVSPMPRVERDVLTRAYHYADGGYYDNDGTGSAIEFLYYAYLNKSAQNNQPADGKRHRPVSRTTSF